MAERKLGVGVIGAFAWAEKAHLPGYAHYDRCRKVAICDIIPERARHLADMFGFETTYDSLDAMLADPAIEMVDICTPTDTHLALSRQALSAGKHVLCEKPIALSAPDAFAFAKEAEDRSVRTKVGFTFRYSPALKQIKSVDSRWYPGRDLSRSRLSAEFAVARSLFSRFASTRRYLPARHCCRPLSSAMDLIWSICCDGSPAISSRCRA